MHKSHNLSSIQDSSSPRQITQTPTEINIPHITKKMNTVEKYINQFNLKTENITLNHNKSPTIIKYSSIVNEEIDNNMKVNPFFGSSLITDINHSLIDEDKCCLKYDSVLDKTTEERVNKLSRL